MFSQILSPGTVSPGETFKGVVTKLLQVDTENNLDLTNTVLILFKYGQAF